MDPLTLFLAALIVSAAATIVVLAAVQTTKWSRCAWNVKRLIAEREGVTDHAVIAELDERMVAAASRLASLSVVTKTRQGWALIFTAILFFVSGAVAAMQSVGSADPAQGTPAFAFTAVCLVLGAGALVLDDRLLEARRVKFRQRERADDESAEHIARDYF